LTHLVNGQQRKAFLKPSVVHLMHAARSLVSIAVPVVLFVLFVVPLKVADQLLCMGGKGKI